MRSASENKLTALSGFIAKHTPVTKSPALEALVRKLQQRYSASISGILFYGSCLRSGDHFDGLVDLYVIVDGYASAYGRGLKALANRMLPPNVFYLEAEALEQRVRAKYAVLSLPDFQRGTSLDRFHSYIWGRFTQPIGIAYVRDEETKTEIHRCLAQAVSTFTTRVTPRLPNNFTAESFWQQGLSLSYQSELRVEKSDRAQQLHAAATDYYENIVMLALRSSPYRFEIEEHADLVCYRTHIPESIRLLNRVGWVVRRAQGKVLSVLRLLKAFYTFQGGLDYIVWKLERHSGAQIEVPERVRKYPLFFVWGMFWKLYRQGIFR